MSDENSAEVRNHDTTPPHPTPPPRPNPSADLGMRLSPGEEDADHAPPSPSSLDIFTLTPISALKLLCAGIEALVRMTGDIPPTPPLSQPTIPNMRSIQAEKENIARSQYPWNADPQLRPRTPSSSSAGSDDYIDGVSFKKTPLGSPEMRPTEPYIIIGANAEPLNVQHSAITRKFYSKLPPAISLEDYLMRMHRFCPMSTAIYLAASTYIHRLAIEERAIAVTRRNCHRLILAALRVAMKALEDMSYPHRRFAKVGGVSEAELARLEISFCFLTNFDLALDQETLQGQAVSLREVTSLQGAVGGQDFALRMSLRPKRPSKMAVSPERIPVMADA